MAKAEPGDPQATDGDRQATAAAPGRWQPDRHVLWLVIPAGMALAPHALYVPAWVSVAVALGVLWRLSRLWRKDSRPQKALRIVLVAAATLATYLQFGTLAGPQAGIAMLVLMGTLKLLESEGRRDHAVMVLVSYFMLMAVLIHHQEIAAAAWLVLAIAALTASLVANQTATPLAPRPALALAGGYLLQALPLAILLFFLFPRLPAPLAGLVHAETGRTGLSDNMAPGSVSQLIRSDEVAFRVDFADPAVDARGLYWRGPVLVGFDGRTWRRGRDGREPTGTRPVGRALAYTVTLEASGQPWLPVSGLVTTPPLPSSRITANLEWLSPRPLGQRVRYAVEAWPDYRLETDLSPGRRVQALSLPEGSNPETAALAARWAAEAANPQAIVQRALSHFRQEPFHYTLNPPLLGANAVDQFLFASRRGFCEHYAGAFTVLMRAAGVPARVVTGYQGGERNPVGGHWIVRSRDAHAWAEVWLEGSGWVQVDPTAAVAPQRIELGLDAALPIGERPMLNLPPDWLRPLRQAWDFVDNGWNQWVLGYDFERQRRLLAGISPDLASLKGMLWAMLAGVAALLALLALLLFRRPPARPRDELSRLYGLFLARLARSGLPRGATEGPADYAARAGHDRPDLAEDIGHISRLYIALRYGKAAPAGVAELRRRVRAFRAGRRPGRPPR
jgi:transglutaminase-like putative cysteine protease